MANKKITDLTEDTVPQLGSQLEIVRDPTGTPLSRKAYLYNLLDFLPDGTVLNGKISVTVATNNLTLALKTQAGNDPSAADPVLAKINGTWRSCTAALSVTKNAGTDWMALGTNLPATETDLFPYLIWNTTPATDIMDIGFSRAPYGNVYSDFSGTTTNALYLAYGNASAPTATDDVINIGRFAATLSAGAGYTWSVPTYTSVNLRQLPTFETRELTWTPTHSRSGTAYTNLPTTNSAFWKIIRDRLFYYEVHTQNATPGGTGDQQLTTVWTNLKGSRQVLNAENGSDSYACVAYIPSGSAVMTIKKYDGTTDVTASKQYVVEGYIAMRV